MSKNLRNYLLKQIERHNESEDDDNSDIANNVVKEKRFDTPKQGVE